ncbi:MAG TPA: outer membrane protein assembly factor BamB [Burkholderiaceae bacterium]|nr:outer membrane protein assembly factor BamB [Burkholderiaceae bacterium]
MSAARARAVGPRSLLAALLAAAALLAGCAASKPKPEPLEPLTPKISVTSAWTGRVDGVKFPLAVAVTRGAFTVAGDDGTVLALEAETGRELWRGTAGEKLSAGVGSDGRFAGVVTREGELVVFDKGVVKWRKPLGGRVTTAPLVAGERVFVLGVDRTVQAFDALDGRKLWIQQRPGDPLTLAQTGVLSAFKDTLIVGQGPRMAGLDPLTGTVRWDVAIGAPRGANELERLADLVGPGLRISGLMCARSFQAAVGCVDGERGSLLWNKNIGGLEAIGGDDQVIIAGDASDRINAWKTITGDAVWSSEKLRYRGLSAPLVVGKSVVFGDEDGTLHWLARDTGEAQLRLPTDGSAVIAQPVMSGATLLVVTRKGGLYAFRP